MNNSDTGFVLSVTPYRESDGMVLFLGEDYGLLRFVLPGFYKVKSKQGSLGHDLTKVKYRFNYRENSLNRIINGELLDSYKNNRENFRWLTLMSFLSEIIIKTYDDEHRAMIFDFMDRCLKQANPEVLILEVLVDIIKYQGIEPKLSGCVVCETGGIDYFSISQGGFVCGRHSNTVKKTSKDVMICLIGLFKKKDISSYINDRLTKEIMDILVQYLEFHGDYKFNSWKLISDV